MSDINARQVVKEAAAKGLKFVRCGSLNVGARGLKGTPAFRLADAQKHGKATDPFGNSAALWTKYDIAREIGNPKGVRAVGLANGRNPISIIVPCHRVIGSNGALTGYGGGIERKRWLLAHEARHGGLAATALGAR